MLLPHQKKFKRAAINIRNANVLDTLQVSIKAKKVNINSISGSFVRNEGEASLVSFIKEAIQERVDAKRAYHHELQSICVSIYKASKSTYIKARNLNKKKKLLNK